VAQGSLAEAAAVIQTLSGRAPGSKLANDMLQKLNMAYGAVTESVSVMTQIKVTKRGPGNMPLTPPNAKQMLQKLFVQLKDLHECCNVGKAVGRS